MRRLYAQKKTKDELHHSIKTCASELEFATNRLDKKNDEIHMLETSVQQLSKKTDELYEENLNLKSQISSELDIQRHLQNLATASSNPSANVARKPTLPKVFLIGTSNVKGI